MEFVPYPKTPRLKRGVIVTEKLDGTNAQIVIKTHADCMSLERAPVAVSACGGFELFVGSRNRWITPGKDTDNYGFASWCQRNAEELFKLGEGQHFGEWYGQGIARGYDLPEKRFALFNVDRWELNPDRPACCEVVPVLKRGDLSCIDDAVLDLAMGGSVAAPGFMRPEGVIVYHSAARQCFKVLIENDELPKGRAA